ncbi:MAG: hypothetical protein IJB92_02365 [Clostridia bacterium]|nr:hypothetical protein [Clostridia bacterium]
MGKKLILIFCVIALLSTVLFGCQKPEETMGDTQATPDVSALVEPSPVPSASPQMETIIISVPEMTPEAEAEPTASPDTFFNIYLDGKYVAQRGFITYIEGAIMLPAQAIADALSMPFLVDNSTGITYIGSMAELTVSDLGDELIVGLNNEKQADGTAIMKDNTLYLNASVALEVFDLGLDMNEVGDVFLSKLPEPTPVPTEAPESSPSPSQGN